MQHTIEISNLHKKIGKKEIIKGLTFSIRKGEVFGLIGPNGAGKTTTIRMIVGLIGITEGEVRILGQSIENNFKEAIREVGAIVENPEMYPFMSGYKNLIHFARMIPGITKERIDEVVRIVGLEKPIHEKVKKYSLGMRQRLGVAQALLHSPSVLILDEPTNGLDPAGIREIRQYIRRLAEEEGVSVIVSSHMLSEIQLMCDRIGIIKNGELIAIEDVRANQDVEEQQGFTMDVQPIDQALAILRTREDISVEQTEELIRIQCDREVMPRLVQELVRQDISIYEITQTKDSVEDRFFDLIGENIIE
ncbi:MAG TPA: ABC transporter ATP-binding protein [Bacillota bacterium]|nr:ABC transporter ATP-binding protein [Bacillota bacterium]